LGIKEGREEGYGEKRGKEKKKGKGEREWGGLSTHRSFQVGVPTPTCSP